MSFETTWLDLREPADHAARDKALLEAARDYLRAGGPAPLGVDLGSGTGSTLRAFGPGDGVRWRLFDHDPRLLEAAAARLDRFDAVERAEGDLGALSPGHLAGARLVTASALFDLASRAFVDRVAGMLAAQRTALYAALNYDGSTTWSPTLEPDARMLAAFNAHQRGDKGLGPALGPDATEALREAFEARGYTVRIAPSPWRLGPGDGALRDALLGGFVGAVAETALVDAAELDAWARARRRQPGDAWVGHWDVLALPPEA